MAHLWTFFKRSCGWGCLTPTTFITLTYFGRLSSERDFNCKGYHQMLGKNLAVIYFKSFMLFSSDSQTNRYCQNINSVSESQ